MAKHTFTNNPNSVTIKISFDYKHNEGEIPIVVYDLSNTLLWKTFHMSKVNENEFTHHEFTHTYYKPFSRALTKRMQKFISGQETKLQGNTKM